MASVFSMFNVERVHRRPWRARDETSARLFQYVAGFFNPQRHQSMLGRLNPMDFKKQAQLT
jgi:hypothetical protein